MSVRHRILIEQHNRGTRTYRKMGYSWHRARVHSADCWRRVAIMFGDCRNGYTLTKICISKGYKGPFIYGH